ncbi:SusC/RagA family TonB-linked outer membrane protein [Acetobacteroides hydrogenigenes]|uniref:TonB-linked SusC/RagA family outer membrane protein n=1 Tax=Acetobacteroides hydrogenigenes TaxID=979970 RepID=A0A4R2E1K6_9BACT|nr:TonB-dependent receptor [Acetobacteroides hydrogenigenes]TCN61698.1 TonB-linked SusC/RagA family outer membrane protein [Acetobacteroides hydrogenigenes]
MYKPFKPNLAAKSLMLMLTLAIFNLLATPSLAQDLKVTGKVTDTKSTTIPGATIKVKGKQTGTATDIDGNFTLKASKGDVLVVSYVGYKAKEVTVVSSSTITVILEEDNQRIDEVVVVGYGTMKKSDLTGAVSSVKKEDITKRATTNAAEALQGKIAGVNIQKSGGNAGAGVQMKIRGVNTIGGNDPLYIIDGFPGSINSVNPSDIESIEILKDGAASAIYGSIAANGVVIVTTKKAKEGQIVVDFNSYLSITKTAKRLNLLNAKEYVSVHKQMYDNYNTQFPDDAITLPQYITNAPDVDTDWQDAIFRSGLAQNYTIGITGGQENLKFALSSNYNNEKGILIGNDVNHKNARMKINLKKSIFEVDANMFFKASRNEQPKFSIKEAYMITPLIPIYDNSREFGFGLTDKLGLPNNRNVMADDRYEQSYSKKQHFNGNIALAINIAKGLQFKTSYSYKAENYQGFYHAPRFVADVKAPNDYPYNSEDRSLWQEQLWDNIITFNRQFGKHSVNAMLGTSTTLTESNWNGVGVEGKKIVYSVDANGKLVQTVVPGGFLDEGFTTIDAGKGGTYSGSGSNYEYNRLSFFGRLNYTYDNKYLLQATLRRDASSKFGKNKRWGTFPSIALGWKLSEEEFFPKDIALNNLKIRGSFGRLGNENALGYYDFLPSIVTGNNLWYGYVQGSGYNPWPGSIATLLSNDDLMWETTNSINVGIDYGMFKNKLTGSLNYFQKNTSDMLIPRVPAPSSGYDSQTMNVGEIENSGIEFEINYNGQSGKLNYNVGFNISYLKNEVVKLSDKDQVIFGEGLKYGTEHFPTQTRVGKPIASYYLYKTDGIFQSLAEVNSYVNKNGEKLQPTAQPGDIRFKDVNGDGAITEADKDFCGSGMPKVEANINFSASYSGFDLSFLLGSGWGHKLYNGNRYFYEAMNSGSNMLTSTTNAWTPTNTNTDVPRAILQDPNGNSRESDRFLEKGDFIRLRQIQIGYSLPKDLIKRAGITNIRIYASGENLYTWTKYSGIDPEFGRSNVLNTGIDNLLFPFTKSYVVGLQFTF